MSSANRHGAHVGLLPTLDLERCERPVGRERFADAAKQGQAALGCEAGLAGCSASAAISPRRVAAINARAPIGAMYAS
jgi:hypothetical protein